MRPGDTAPDRALRTPSEARRLTSTTGRTRNLERRFVRAGTVRTLMAHYVADGRPLLTGLEREATIPFACTITGWVLLGDQSGSIEIDIWKTTFAGYPPSVGDSITASAKPTLSSAPASEDSTLTGWTTAITAGDCLRFNIDSVDGVLKRATLSLTLKET